MHFKCITHSVHKTHTPNKGSMVCRASGIRTYTYRQCQLVCVVHVYVCVCVCVCVCVLAACTYPSDTLMIFADSRVACVLSLPRCFPALISHTLSFILPSSRSCSLCLFLHPCFPNSSHTLTLSRRMRSVASPWHRE